jgi:RNA polymerase sigma-70 factor (ECF subfamily)
MDDRTRMAHIAKAVGGDSEAMQLLLIEHHDALHAKVRAHLGPSMKRHLDPDDVIQEAYARAFRAVTECSFENAVAFYAWLEGITMNTLRDEHRFLRRRKRDIGREVHGSAQAPESYEQFLARLSASDSTPSRKVAKAEAAAAVISSLARLTDDQRHVVQMRFLDGLSVAETAAALDKTEAAIHMLCHRALKALREVMHSMSRFLSSQ